MKDEGCARRAAALGLGAVLLWCALAASPGIAASLFDDNEARKQIAAERQRVDELKRDLNTQQQAVEARIGRVEETLKSQPLLDLFTQLEALKLEMNRLRGQIEVLNNNVENTAKRQRDMYLDLDTRLRRFEQQAVPAPPASAPSTSTAPSPSSAPSLSTAPSPSTAPSGSVPSLSTASASAASASTPSSTPTAPVASTPAAPASTTAAAKPPTVATVAPPAVATVTNAESGAEVRAYEAAQGQRRIGNYQGAIVAFQNFIKQYPRSSLAPRAQYWIGDSYFNLRDYKLAIASQQALIAGYPDSPTVPDAMLNIASSQIEMGESNAGRKILEDLVAKFPISDAADKAKRRLASSTAPAAKQ